MTFTFSDVINNHILFLILVYCHDNMTCFLSLAYKLLSSLLIGSLHRAIQSKTVLTIFFCISPVNNFVLPRNLGYCQFLIKTYIKGMFYQPSKTLYHTCAQLRVWGSFCCRCVINIYIYVYVIT